MSERPPSSLPPIFDALAPQGPEPQRFAQRDGRPKLVRGLYKAILPLKRPPRGAPRRGPAGGSAPKPGPPSPPQAPAPLDTGPLDDDLVPSLFANCLPVFGVERALVCDLQRREAHAIAPALLRLLEEHPGSTLGELKALFEGRLDARLDALIGELRALGLLHLSAAPLPPLPLRFEHPARITNAVLDRDLSSCYPLAARMEALAALGCEHALLRLKGPGLAARALEELEDRGPLALELWVEGETPAAMAELLARHPRITDAVLFGHPPGREGRLTTLPEALSFALPSQPTPGSQAVNVEHFAESLAHHSFFHRKAFITAEGLPSSGVTVFRDQPLIDLIEDPDFCASWHVQKEQVLECRGCALRRVCVDPAPPIPDGAGGYRRPSACPLRC